MAWSFFKSDGSRKQSDSGALQLTVADAKGDIFAATAADTVTRLAVGSNGQVLTAASGQSTGLEWATPSSGFVSGELAYAVATGTVSGSANTWITAVTAPSFTLSATTTVIAWWTSANRYGPTNNGNKTRFTWTGGGEQTVFDHQGNNAARYTAGSTAFWRVSLAAGTYTFAVSMYNEGDSLSAIGPHQILVVKA